MLTSPELLVTAAVAGALVGVLGVLATLLAIVARLDQRYMPRELAMTLLGQMQKDVESTKHIIEQHVATERGRVYGGD